MKRLRRNQVGSLRLSDDPVPVLFTQHNGDDGGSIDDNFHDSAY
jgi:hypothetical protein